MRVRVGLPLIALMAGGFSLLPWWGHSAAQSGPEPSLTLLFPQIAAGQGFVAEVILKSHSDVAVSGDLVLKQRRGEPLILSLNGTSADSFPFELSPRGVLRLETDSEGPVQAGYALVELATPGAHVSGSVVYRFGGSEVSVAPAAPAAGYAGFVEHFTPQATAQVVGEDTGVGTGVALVNPAEDALVVHLALLGADGELIATEQLTLEGGEHRAFFVDQLFEGVLPAGQAFEGSLEITAESGRFAMTILRMRFPSGRIANLGGQPVDSAFAVVGVAVAPMTANLLLDDQTVLVRGDRIVAVGPRDEIAVPPDAVVIDGTGRYLLPGLADMHVHMAFTEEFLLFVANGVTTVREMWGSSGHVAVRDQIAAGLWSAAPTLLVAGPGFDDNPVTWPRTIVLNSPDQAESLVADYQQAGYDFIKVYNNLTPAAFQALTAAADARGLRVIGHVPWQVGPTATLQAAPASLEHFLNLTPLVGINGWTSGGITAGSMQALAEQLVPAGVWHCPTLVTNELTFTVAERNTFLDTTPEVRFLPPARVQGWRDSPQFNTPSQRETILANQLLLLKALSDAEGRLLLGTDAGFPAVVPGFTIHDELRIFKSAGLEPYQALRAATRDPAAFAGQLDEFGTVQVGRRADLLLLNANPLADVANVADRAGVMVRGRWLPEAELQRRLEAQASRFAAAAATVSKSQNAAGRPIEQR